MSSLLVVKGSSNKATLDPNFACLAHDQSTNSYAVVKLGENGAERTTYAASDRRKLERFLEEEAYKGTQVFADPRNEGVLPLSLPKEALDIDFDQYRRAKSDDELDTLARLSRTTFERLHMDADGTAKAFRGAEVATAENMKSAFQVTKRVGFTQYRGGYQDELGRCSDLTRIVPHTQDWEERLGRVYRGLYDVQQSLKAGVSFDMLNDILLAHTDPEKDFVYGDVVHHTGHESHELKSYRSVEQYDFITVGCAVSDGNETALVYTSGNAIHDPPAYGATLDDYDYGATHDDYDSEIEDEAYESTTPYTSKPVFTDPVPVPCTSNEAEDDYLLS